MTSLSDGVSCLMRIAHIRVLLDTAHCPMVTSKYIGRTTVSDSQSEPLDHHIHIFCRELCSPQSTKSLVLSKLIMVTRVGL